MVFNIHIGSDYIQRNDEINIKFWIHEPELNRDTMIKNYISMYGFPLEQVEKTVDTKIISETKRNKLYDEAQINLDMMLNKINFSLFYSSRNKKIYSETTLLSMIGKFDEVFDFKLEGHCDLFKIRHINIYILRDELEELLYFNDLSNRIRTVSIKLISKEGISKADIVTRLLLAS